MEKDMGEEKNLLEVVQVFMDAVPSSEPGLATDLRGQAGVVSVRGDISNPLTSNINTNKKDESSSLITSLAPGLTKSSPAKVSVNEGISLQSGDQSHGLMLGSSSDDTLLQEDEQIVYHPSIVMIQDIAHIARHFPKTNSNCDPAPVEEESGSGQEFAITRHHISFLVLNPFMCSICGQVFSTTKLLSKHVLDEHGLKSVEDENCTDNHETTDKRSNTAKVNEEKHTRKLDASKDPQKDLSIVLLKKLYDNIFQCFVCESEFEREHERDVHMAEHHKDENVICKVCDVTFDPMSWGKYIDHLKQCSEIMKGEEQITGQAGMKRKRGRPPKHLSKKPRGRPKGSVAKPPAIIPQQVLGVSRRSNRTIKLPGRLSSYEIQKAKGEKTKGEDDEEDDDDELEDGDYKFPTAALKHHGLKDTASRPKKPKSNVPKEKGVYKCEFCPEEFHWKILRGQHRMSVHTDKQFECEYCQKTFPVDKRGLYIQHLRCHAKDKQAGLPSICNICGKAFRLLSSLTNHMRIHPDFVDDRSMEFCCETCGKRFTTLANLQSHQRVHSEDRPFQCSSCGKCFKVKAYLELHMRRHTGEKPHKCSYCDEHFSSHVAKRKHETFHTNELLYICTFCSKKFRTSSQLTVHKRVHTQVKPYTCQTCGKAFRSHDTLSVHTRVHTGVKPYQCSYCGLDFSQKVNMIHHERSIHTGEKPYRCDICDKRFSRSNRLKVHLEKDHKVIQEVTIIDADAEWLQNTLPATVTIQETVGITDDAEEAVRTLQSLAGTVINIVEV